MSRPIVGGNMKTTQKAWIFLSFIPVFGPLALVFWFVYKDVKSEINRIRARLWIMLTVFVGALAGFAIVAFLNYLNSAIPNISDIIDEFGVLLSFLVAGAPLTVLTAAGLVMLWDWFEIH